MKKHQLPKPFPDYFSPEFLAELQAQPSSVDRTLSIFSYTILSGGWFEWDGEKYISRFDDDEDDLDVFFDSA
jgi:hypothetical protein